MHWFKSNQFQTQYQRPNFRLGRKQCQWCHDAIPYERHSKIVPFATCMYTCMLCSCTLYVYIHEHAYICMYVHVRMYVHVCSCMYVSTCMFMYMYVCMFMYVYVHVCMYV